MAVVRFLCWTLPILLWDGLRLVAMVIALSPGFARFAWYYATCNRTSVRFGHDSCRQTLDVYSAMPLNGNTNNTTNNSNSSNSRQDTPDEGTSRNIDRQLSSASTSLLPRPVVIFYTGGAWLIGFKMWGALLARALTACNIVVVMPDYRNYPWATVPDAVADVELSLQWTRSHVADYGGDPDNIVVVGQSAGGHLVTTALLRLAVQQSQKEAGQHQQQNDETIGAAPILDDRGPDEESGATPLHATDFRGLISLSSPYCLTAMQQTFVKHGLDKALVDRIFGGERDAYDPLKIVQECIANDTVLAAYLPPMRIYHGSRDKTVPPDGSIDFVRELERAAAPVQFHMYEGWSHTDPILEGPMDADHRFHRDVYAAVQEWTEHTTAVDEWPEECPLDSQGVQRRLCPHTLIRLGRFFNPF
jgi:prenylcysteine alpha-carboxyl methylesterase